jgi:DNA replication and repair protein RecF
MSINRLYLENFRIHKSFLFEGNQDIIFLEGANGAGKTSVLEAISFLSPGKGLRNVSFDDAIKFSTNSWTVFVSVENTNDGLVEIGMNCGESRRRIIKVDNKNVRSSSSLLNLIKIIWLTPSQDGLLAESKSLRRKFLDRLVYNFNPSHAEDVSRYEHTLRSRLRLLKDGDADPIWLTQLERVLAETSVKISAARLDAIERLNIHMNMEDNILISPEISLCCAIANNINSNSYSNILVGFERSRNLDAKVGKSLYGVHRADFIIKNSVKGISASKASTGELKVMLLSLILAQVESLNKVSGVRPVILLDDIFSHLDEKRSAALIEKLEVINAQVWVTGTNSPNFTSILKCKEYVKIKV